MVVHPGSDRVSRARPYSGTATGESLRVGVRGPNPLRPAFPCRSAARATLRLPGGRPYNPGGAKPSGRVRSPVWPSPPFARRYSGDLVIDFSSSGYLDVSVPPVPSRKPMCSAAG